MKTVLAGLGLISQNAGPFLRIPVPALRLRFTTNLRPAPILLTRTELQDLFARELGHAA